MAVYAYKGLDARGKSVKGVRDADSAKALRNVLKRDGILATEVLEQSEFEGERLLRRGADAPFQLA